MCGTLYRQTNFFSHKMQKMHLLGGEFVAVFLCRRATCHRDPAGIWFKTVFEQASLTAERRAAVEALAVKKKAGSQENRRDAYGVKGSYASPPGRENPGPDMAEAFTIEGG
jgi:hypothetical protein